MTTIKVNLKPQPAINFPIYIGLGKKQTAVSLIKKHYSGTQIVVVTDTNVAKLYGQKLKKDLIVAGFSVLFLEVSPGEGAKSTRIKEKLELQMLENKIDRHALVLAFGGGVIGDLAGFIASTYMRGIRYIQIPTTLLAMIDSSVGGKTAINTKFGKNLVGAFYQPLAVIMDLEYLNTLPKKMRVNGLIEAVKIFLTSERESFYFVRDNLDEILQLEQKAIQRVIKNAVALKVKVVEEDEKEENLRMILNFGHTIGHAIEKVKKYKILHGYAVALGILVEARISYLTNKLDESDLSIITELIRRLGINTKILKNLNSDEIALATLGDKKNKKGEISCILLKSIGEVTLEKTMVASTINHELIVNSLNQIIEK